MRSALFAIVAMSVASVAHADVVDQLALAHELEARLDYEGALAIVDAEIKHGSADVARTVELHLFAGKLAAGLDRGETAQHHFAIALAIAPATALPDGTSPKIVAPFESARDESVALRVHASRENDAVLVVPDVDPLALVMGIAVRHATGVAIDRVSRRIALPAGALDVAALDRDGNRVWIGPVPEASATGGVPPKPERRFITTWLPWTGVSAVFIGGASALAWRSSVMQDDWNALRADDGMHDYSELAAIESRGRDYALAANIGFGLAAGAAAVAVYFLVTK